MNKNSILTLVVIIVIGIGAYLYFNSTKTDNTSSLLAQNKTLQSPDAQYIYSLSQKMDQVQLDDSIFSSQIFQGLKDNAVTFTSQPSGRDNPFAPI
jgi:uncharacterized protein (UPF0333 family)